MPTFFGAVLAALLALIVLLPVVEDFESSLAPDHVPRQPMLALDPAADLAKVHGIDDGQHPVVHQEMEHARPAKTADALAYAALPAPEPG